MSAKPACSGPEPVSSAVGRCTRMSEFASIKKLWAEHRSRPFPRALVGEEVDGHCLVTLDTEAAGCIAGFVSGTRVPRLDAKRVAIVSDCAAS